jgi:predicted short-subunit dehydrogenase-like oxidoreductase (DUF2520 family)
MKLPEMKHPLKIAILGSGNIATFFGNKFFMQGHQITQIISPTIEHAKQLSSSLQCDFATSMDDLNTQVDVILLAIKDDLLRNISFKQNTNNALIIHTAGSVRLSEISSVANNIGSIWCMYSINKNHLPDRSDIPLIINANNEASLANVKILSQCISQSIYELNDNEKSVAHLSAVFANNFANHLFTIGQEILSTENISFDILIPLIQNTIEKLSYSTPDKLQTGPAIRHDDDTIAKHKKILKSNDEFLKIYKLLTQSIQQRY